MADFNKAWSRGGNILKLQTLSRTVDGRRVHRKILTYNKKRDLVLFLSPTELDGERMMAWMDEHGFKGQDPRVDAAKGYFLGFSDAEGELVLITDPVLPAQPW